MYFKNYKKEKGFTLIEMLIAVSLFSVVLIVSLGSIMTIVDVNKKSQTLTTVMNDLSFALENMTRSIKTGKIQGLDIAGGGKWLKLDVIPQATEKDPAPDPVTYELINGAITANLVPITSDQITIETLRFHVFYGNDNRQPRVLMLVSGSASIGKSISSDFTIQTTVSQRDLVTDNFVNN